MIDRRILLASVASLFGLAAFRWLRATPAQAAEKFEIEKTDAEWRAQLTPQQYEILRKQGTERPGSSPLLKEHRKGIFACAGCDLPLFSSETKFESGTGWPSFYQPLDNAARQDRGPHLRHAAHRSALPPLRRPSRPCLRRRAEADRLALLHRRFWRWCSTRRRPSASCNGLRPAIVARPAIVPRSSDRGFLFKSLIIYCILLFGTALATFSSDCGHGFSRPAGRPDRIWRKCHGYLRRTYDGGRRPAGAVLRAGKHLGQHRQLADHRVQAHRHQFPRSHSADRADPQLAGGVTTQSRSTNSVQGDVQTASVATFMAINGDGFFAVQKPGTFTDGTPVFDGVDRYTRRGDFQLDKSGYLVNGAGYYLEGVPIDPTTGNPLGSSPQVLKFQNDFLPAQADHQDRLPRQPRQLSADHQARHLGAGIGTAAAGIVQRRP